jgi:hypothetical protein
MGLDLNLFGQKYSINEVIDKEMMDGSKILDFNGFKVTVNELHDIFPLREQRMNIFIDFEDICVYTSLGLLNLINEILGTSIKINKNEFLNREHYPHSIDYIIDILKKKNVSDDMINETYVNFYPEICKRSPTTSFFNNILMIKHMTSQLTVRFPFDRPDLPEFINEWNSKKFYNSIKCIYKVFKTQNEFKSYIMKSNDTIYVIGDMNEVYETFILNNIKNKSLLGYSQHNGLNPYLVYLYLENFPEKDEAGPNNISLRFMEEII